MIRPPPRSTLTDTIFPYTTLVRSGRLPVARQAGGDLVGHVVEVEGPTPRVAGGLAHRRARQRWHEDLGLDPGGDDLGGTRHLGGQQPALDEEHVAVVLGALVAGPDLLDHAVELHPPAGGQRAVEGHDVVALEGLAVRDADPGPERPGVPGADEP